MQLIILFYPLKMVVNRVAMREERERERERRERGDEVTGGGEREREKGGLEWGGARS